MHLRISRRSFLHLKLAKAEEKSCANEVEATNSSRSSSDGGIRASQQLPNHSPNSILESPLLCRRRLLGRSYVFLLELGQGERRRRRQRQQEASSLFLKRVAKHVSSKPLTFQWKFPSKSLGISRGNFKHLLFVCSDRSLATLFFLSRRLFQLVLLLLLRNQWFFVSE